ncbi:MAG: hypothetical protein FWF15_08425 [Oscillospiraceae bacterium]|nr:hypothetical protein [Oscillospiraceae bacterium]
MKIKIFILFTIICIALCIASCSKTDTPINPEEQANAYFTIFEKLYENDPALNADSIYLAIDLTNVKLADTSFLIALIQSFCDSNEYILLQDTIEGLIEKGYVKDLYFEEGFVIVFNDIELTKNNLVTSAQKWRSGTGAIGADYTVTFKNNAWEITKTTNTWIS